MSRTIMIVDDDPDDIEIFIDGVHEVDPTIICTSARNGKEAMELLRSNRAKPEFIFVDLNMPKMNGKQFISQIKRDPALKDICIVIYSTSHLFNEREETKLLGADYFFTKPTTLDELCHVINLVMSKTEEY